MSQSPSIHHVSDTARWAAVYRAEETERSDALFRDPFARRLAGERGQEIAKALPFHGKNSWSWITRTWLFDRIITEQVEQGAQLVVNLAAGLDVRPYRMPLPEGITWVEADFPEILDYKEAILGHQKPACRVERIRIDLADVSARHTLLDSFKTKSTKALVISEGLLVYLSAQQVGTLARDLSGIPAFQNWLLDITSPGLLQMIRKNTESQISQGAAEMQFAPENGPEFFTAHGWKPAEVHSILKSAAKLKRLPFLLRLAALFPENPERMGSRPWGGVCLLKKSGNSV